MQKLLLVLIAPAAFLPISAFAAVPAIVTTAIETTQTDAVTVAGLMIGVTAALLVFKYIRRLMK